MYLYTRMAMPMAIKAKKTLDMNMMQRQETPPKMDKDLLEELYIHQSISCVWTKLTSGST